MDEVLEWGARILKHRHKNMNDAVMFDIDDTIIESSTGKPMEMPLRLFNFAKSLGYIMIIITARPKTEEAAKFTLEQLKQLNIEPHWLIFSTAEEKGDIKKQLLQYHFVLSIGDQNTDITNTKHFIRLPNSMDPNIYYN